METQIRLGVYRIEPWNQELPRALQLHRLRSDSLHEALEESSAWRVDDWGSTHDSAPHEFVELLVTLVSNPAFQAVAVSALGYVAGKLGEAALDAAVLEPFKELVRRLIGRQKKKEIQDFQITLPDGTWIQVDPGDNDARITINLQDGSVESVNYSFRSG